MPHFYFSGLYRLDRLHFIVCFNVGLTGRKSLKRCPELELEMMALEWKLKMGPGEAFILAGFAAASFWPRKRYKLSACSSKKKKKEIILLLPFHFN